MEWKKTFTSLTVDKQLGRGKRGQIQWKPAENGIQEEWDDFYRKEDKEKNIGKYHLFVVVAICEPNNTQNFASLANDLSLCFDGSSANQWRQCKR